MIFVIGGAYCGKSGYVRNNLTSGAIADYNAPYDTLKHAAAVRDFHLYIRRALTDGKDALEETKRLIRDNPDIIIISNEDGCGVVPVDAFEREWREQVGRVSCYLAQKAEKVIRVVCGIGTVIK